MSSWLPPRLRPMLGPDLNSLMPHAIERLLGLVEDTDLEFKLQPWDATEGGSKECALDIADKANAVGALLVVGVEEDGDGRASRLIPVHADVGDLGLRVHQIVAQRISPPPVLTHRAVPLDDGHIHLFAIAPTTRSPHGVAVGGSAFRFPVRSGVTRRYLTEPELADRYVRRFEAATDQRDRLTSTHRRALDLIPDKGGDADPWSWLVVSAVPEFPGKLELRRGLIEEWQEWINPALADFPTFVRNTTAHLTAGFRSLLIHDALNRSNLELYSSGGILGLAGEGAIVLGHLGGRGSAGSFPDTSMLYDEHLIGDLINAVGIVAQHAARTGAVGYLAVGAELVSEQPMLIGQYRSMWKGQFDGSRSVPMSTGRSEHTSPLDGLVLPGMDRVALARLLALDLLSAFGMSEVQQITEAAELALDRFTNERKPYVERWAEAAGVPTVEHLTG